MTEATTDALQQMARHVATQLVADALKAMTGSTVTVTLHPVVVGQGIVQAPRLLGPAKRRGRKPGPKPKLRKSQRKVDKSEGPSSSGRTRVSKTRNVGSSPAGPAIERRCRGCKRMTAITVVDGRNVRCSACGHEWAARGLSTTPDVDVDRCTRCDHTRNEHDPQTKKCLSAKCVCTGFWQ